MLLSDILIVHTTKMHNTNEVNTLNTTHSV